MSRILLIVVAAVALAPTALKAHMPATFEEKERDWPNYFLFEPGLHFAVRF